jgi:streptogramin lyase
MLTVTGTAGGVSTTLNSIATAIGQTVNITPLTDLIVSIAAGQPSGGGSGCTSIDPVVNASCRAAMTAANTGTNLSAAVTAVTNMIASLNTTNVNPLNGAFVANGTGIDAVLHAIFVAPATSQGATATVTLIGAPTQQLGSVTMPAQPGGTPIIVVALPPSPSVITAARQYMTPTFGTMSPVDLNAYYAKAISTGTRGSIAVNWTQPTGLVVNDVSITYTWTCTSGGAGGEFPYTMHATPATGATTASIAAIAINYPGGCPNNTSAPTAASISLQYSVDGGANQVVSQSYGSVSGGGSTPPVTTSALIGTWYATSGDGTTYTFNGNGTYTGWYPGPNGDGSGGYGYEQGTYTWNSATGAFSGYDATHNKPTTTGTVLTVSGNTFLIDGAWSFTRATPPSTIVGSWSPATDTSIVVAFFANGDYMESESAPTGGGGVLPGLEHGTYVRNSTTGALTVNCPGVDTNGTAGFSAPLNVQCTPGTIVTTTAVTTVNGNTMTLVDNSTSPVTNLTFTRVIDNTNSIVGSWYDPAVQLDGTGGSNGMLTFFANGDYMQSESVTDPSNLNAWPGIEHGTYTWNSSTGAFATGGCPPVNTNGDAGLSHHGTGVCSANAFSLQVSGNTMFINGGTFKRVESSISTGTLPKIFTTFTLPAGSRGFGITSGPDGNLWFADEGTNSIGKMTLAGVVTKYTIPTTTSFNTPDCGFGSCPQTIVSGPDGNLWFVEGNGNKIGRITTAGVITEYANTAGGWPQDLAVGSDGNIWFTDQGVSGGGTASVNANGAIGMLNITTSVITKYPLLTGNTQANFITLGPDGAMWFTQAAGSAGGSDKAAKITTAGVITEFANTGGAFITKGSDGNLWATAPKQGAGAIGKLTTTGVETLISVPSGSSLMPFSITAAPDGNLWFSETNGLWPGWGSGGKLGSISTSGVVTEFALPASTETNTTMPSIGVVTVGPDGAIWFTDPRSGRIVRFGN